MDWEYLRKVGLTNGEIKVYSVIIGNGLSSLNKIHEKTGIERRNIYDIINKLIEKGLVSYTVEKGKKVYQITHPKKIINYLEGKKRDIENSEKEIGLHIPDLVKLFNQSKTEVWAEVFRGDESIKALLTEILEHNESYWLGGNSFEHYKAVSENLVTWFSHWMKERVKKKHTMYDLVSYGTWLKGLEPNKKGIHKKNYYEYNQLPNGLYVPMVIIIFGDKVAQVLWSKQPFAFILEGKKVKDSFMHYFNYFWNLE